MTGFTAREQLEEHLALVEMRREDEVMRWLTMFFGAGLLLWACWPVLAGWCRRLTRR